MIDYLARIWHARFFWTHLAMSDLRSRWRRSYFGMLWSMIQPLGMTLLLSLVFSKIFHNDISVYAPYILSGMLIWDFIIASSSGGSLAFVQSDAYIKQCSHPLAIYTLRIVLSNLVIFLMASIVLIIWVLVVMPQNCNISWIAALSIFPAVVFISWPLGTILAYFGARFRDIPHLLGIIFQAVWFISPVYFEAKTFKNSELHGLVDYNPVYHLLELVRAPLLNGKFPTAQNYMYVIYTAIFLIILACLIGYKQEKKVIFYL
jgi:lipopolysaccharide transport system permease protein